MRYAFDTNVFVRALRDPAERRALESFLSRAMHLTVLHAVVAGELRTGARRPEQITALEEGVIGPFERRGRIAVPTFRAFKDAGRVLAELAASGQLDTGRVTASIANDTLIATSCREAGITLVTCDNDFDRIARRVLGFRHVAPWPD